MENKLLKLLKEEYPDIQGNIRLTHNSGVAAVEGEVFGNYEGIDELIKDFIHEEFPGSIPAYNLKVNKGDLTIISTEGSSTTKNMQLSTDLDEVKILFLGMLPTREIVENDKYKFINDNMLPKIDNAFRVLGFFSPIVLDSKMRVIDGNLRLQVAKDNNVDEVPVIIINDSEEKADYLRLALNRTTEFQRWNYPDVDEYVDSMPQLQPILEPLGFFGNKILPESFFAPTVINYEIDIFNEQQQMYNQDEGLAEWAKYRREQIKKKEEEAKAQRKTKKLEGAVSLFDLAPKEEDFEETYDIEEEIHKHEEEMKVVAGRITDNYDEVRRKEIEARGGKWQNTRRTSREVAQEKREEYTKIINDLDIPQDKKDYLIDSLDEVESREMLDTMIEGVMNEEE